MPQTSPSNGGGSGTGGGPDPPGPVRSALLTRRERGLLAFFGSLFFPGLGQIYAGAARRGFVIFCLAVALTVTGFIVTVFDPTAIRALFLLATTALGAFLAIWAAVDALRLVRREPVQLRRSAGWLMVYPLVILAYTGAAFSKQGFGFTFDRTWRSFSVPSASMEPTIHVGDYFLAAVGRHVVHTLDHGHVIVFKGKNGAIFVKRLVGLPGDSVAMAGGRLVVNGAVVPHVPLGPYPLTLADGSVRQAMLIREVLGSTAYDTLDLESGNQLDDMAAVVIPPGFYFVVGDNRDMSNDSRLGEVIDMVTADAIIGTAALVIWSGRNFGRIGTAL